MKKILAVFKALSDCNRLRIVSALSTTDELCACQITELLQVAGATASRHLAILIAAGLLEDRKSGRWVFYRLRSDNAEFRAIEKWMKEELSKSEYIKKDLILLKKIMASEPEEICRKQRGVECCPE